LGPIKNGSCPPIAVLLLEDSRLRRQAKKAAGELKSDGTNKKIEVIAMMKRPRV